MRCTLGGLRASSLSAFETHLWEEAGPGEDAQSQAQISTTSGRQGRGQKDRKKSLSPTWSLLQDIVECYLLIVLVSWAEQDVGRGQENGKLPVVSMWGSSEQTRGAWLLPTLPPIPHHSKRHWGLGEFHVSPGLSIKSVSARQ